MIAVILASLGVGGATVLGALGGFLFKNTIYKHSDIVNAFSAGMMTVAAAFGLLLPSMQYGGIFSATSGILLGTLCLMLCDKYAVKRKDTDAGKEAVILLLLAIAIHNLPEGMAAGVSFGTENMRQAISIAGEIALQNIPEGMVIIGPMLASGMSGRKTFLLAMLTGVIEVLGTFIGYFAVGVTGIILPFVLSFAGGMMLYVIYCEMIPQSCKNKKHAFAYIIGFLVMMTFDSIL